jgi:hypothetical protein
MAKRERPTSRTAKPRAGSTPRARAAAPRPAPPSLPDTERFDPSYGLHLFEGIEEAGIDPNLLLHGDDSVLRVLSDFDFDPSKTTSADIERRIDEATEGALQPPQTDAKSTLHEHSAYISSILEELMEDDVEDPLLRMFPDLVAPAPAHIEVRRLEVALARGRTYLSVTERVTDPSLWQEGWAKQMAQGRSVHGYLDHVDAAPGIDAIDGVLVSLAAQLGETMVNRLPAECDMDAPTMSVGPSEGRAPQAGGADDDLLASLRTACAAMREDVSRRRDVIAMARSSWKLGASLLAHAKRLSPRA